MKNDKVAECNPEEIQLLIKVKLLNLKNIAAFGKVKWLGAWRVLPQKMMVTETLRKQISYFHDFEMRFTCN